MARTKRKVKEMPTIWRVDDRLWNEFIYQVLMQKDPPRKTGRKRIDARKAFDGIIYQMRTGCQWNALPKEFGDDSSVHRTFQRWITLGVWDEIWAILIDHCDELDGVNWQWQSGDATLGKARFGGIKSAEIPRIVARMALSAA